MTNIPGTNVAAPIAPFTTDDSYPSHDSQYGIGGWREVSLLTDRDSIPTSRRRQGMAVYVAEDSKVYYLPTGITNSDWVVYNPGGSLVSGFKQSVGDGTNTTYTITHSLSSRDVAVFLYENSPPYEEVLATIEHTTVDSLTVTFGFAPVTDQYRILIISL